MGSDRGNTSRSLSWLDQELSASSVNSKRQFEAESSPIAGAGFETKTRTRPSQSTVAATVGVISMSSRHGAQLTTSANSDAGQQRNSYTVYPRAPHVFNPAASMR